MRSDPSAIISRAVEIAREMPLGAVETLAKAILNCNTKNWSYARTQVQSVTPQPRFRALAEELLEAWRNQAPSMSPEGVSMALLSAAAAVRRSRQEQQVELVWTGPETASIPLRRTDQALLEVINAARSSLLIVSFAVYRIQNIAPALVRAVEKGVSLRICVEAPEPSGQHMAYDTIAALGHDVSDRAAIYIWPLDKRPTDPNGKPGSLHAKCAVADDRSLFLSSANLTEYAMKLNMELGVLIHGGPLPAIVSNHFARLIENEELKRIQPT